MSSQRLFHEFSLIFRKNTHKISLFLYYSKLWIDFNKTIVRESNKRKECERNNDLTPLNKKQRGRKSNITTTALTHLFSKLEEDSTLTLKQMVDILKSDFDIDSSTSGIDRCLSKFAFAWKNVLPIPDTWNTNEVIFKRQQFLEQLSSYANKNVIYIVNLYLICT